MSRVTEQVYKDLASSEFEMLDERSLEVVKAAIFWPNFEGRMNRFGKSAVTFNLAVSDEVAADLEKMGFKVRKTEIDEETLLKFVNIKVNMKSQQPPLIKLLTESRGKKSTRILDDEEKIKILDSVDIEEASCVINLYESRAVPGKVTGYLKKLIVVQNPKSTFGGRYDDWDSGDNDGDEE